MKHFLFTLCLFVLSNVYADFLPFTQDIPLMPNLVLQEDYLSFDTPSGQILNLSAKTPLPCQKVFDFYSQTLPALGWQEEKKGFFKRNEDTLSFSCKASTVTFEITFENPS